MRRRGRRLTLLAAGAIVAALAIPSLAAADCSIPADGSPGHPHDFTYAASQDFSGSFAQAKQGSYVQIPFTVPAGTTGIRIRYCYDSTSSTVLDMGVYEPLHSGDTVPGMPERRGWSGSAVKDLAISKNGFSPAATYNAGPKDLVEGYTTRAYQPGNIPAGTWTAELGLAYLGIPSTAWRVKVETSTDTGWSDAPYSPAAYDSSPANTQPGWYAGDLHAHGEEEPGNALMKKSFDYAFTDPNGPGLDFLGLVDHNNSINRGEIGRYQADYPGKLIIPGTEVTTYHGHYNSIGSSNFADYRGGDVYKWDPAANSGAGALGASPVQPASTPASQFPIIDSGGGWSQVNHPTIFNNAPAACRGCAWGWSDAQTDYSKVDAIEIQTGPADLGNPPTSQNPYTPQAIALYEKQLAAGNHIAAVGSSDSHKADFADATTAPIGRATTVVHAEQLSHDGIVAGIKAQHTYVKLYGNDGPDVRVDGTAPGAADAIIGDDLKGPSAELSVHVSGVTQANAVRPGSYSLQLLKDGVASGSALPITGDGISKTFDTSQTGRYSVEVLRAPNDPGNVNSTPLRIEDYSTPIWFTKGNNLTLSKAKVDSKHGTAKLAAKVAGPGKLKLSGSNIKGASTTASGASTKNLSVKATGKAAKDLKKKGKAKVTAKVTFTPTGGTAATSTQKITLKKKVKKHHHG